MMRWPWTSRARLDDKDREIARLEKLLASSEAERKRLHDLVYLQNFGQQINDTIATAVSAPENPLSQDEQFERELKQQANERKQHLEHIRRTRPSQLPYAIAEQAVSDAASAARSAHPARTLFDKARKDVTGHPN